MRLLFLWIENYKDIIRNQSFCISGAYCIRYDVENNKLYIIINENYVDGIYGENILDISAVVGNNGAGKTLFSQYLYGYCDSVHPHRSEIEDGENKIIVYEKEKRKESGKRGLIVQYCLKEKPEIDCDEEKIEQDIVDLTDLDKDEYAKAESEHNITTVYFTNTFQIYDVMDNQGYTEFSIDKVNKSLCYTPMLSLQRACINLKKQYGYGTETYNPSIINQYAEKMSENFKLPYANI